MSSSCDVNASFLAAPPLHSSPYSSYASPLRRLALQCSTKQARCSSVLSCMLHFVAVSPSWVVLCPLSLYSPLHPLLVRLYLVHPSLNISVEAKVAIEGGQRFRQADHYPDTVTRTVSSSSSLTSVPVLPRWYRVRTLLRQARAPVYRYELYKQLTHLHGRSLSQREIPSTIVTRPAYCKGLTDGQPKQPQRKSTYPLLLLYMRVRWAGTLCDASGSIK